MSQLSLSERLKKRFILFSSNQALQETIRGYQAEGWEMVCAASLDELGDWGNILLHRFMLLDLGDSGIDAHAVLKQLRYEMQLNIPVFCLGGDEALHAALRSDRADRFLRPDEFAEFFPAIFDQYGWG